MNVLLPGGKNRQTEIFLWTLTLNLSDRNVGSKHRAIYQIILEGSCLGFLEAIIDLKPQTTSL